VKLPMRATSLTIRMLAIMSMNNYYFIIQHSQYRNHIIIANGEIF
jgi:hypothetical protein